MKRSNWFFLAFLTVVFAAIITFGPAGCAKPLTEEQRVAALQQNAADTQAAEQAKANAEAKLAEAKAAGKLDEVKALQIEIEVYKNALIAAKADKAALENPNATGGYNWGAFLTSLSTSVTMPGPAGTIFGVGSFLWGLIQRRKAIYNANVAAGVVNSIDTAKAADPAFKAAISAAGPIIAAELAKVKGAHEFVEENRI